MLLRLQQVRRCADLFHNWYYISSFQMAGLNSLQVHSVTLPLILIRKAKEKVKPPFFFPLLAHVANMATHFTPEHIPEAKILVILTSFLDSEQLLLSTKSQTCSATPKHHVKRIHFYALKSGIILLWKPIPKPLHCTCCLQLV